MSAKSTLPNQLSDLNVSNVYIYVGDAVRDDFTHPDIKQRGIYVPSISASIHSPTSFASIATGCYPPNHGVTSFSNPIHENVERIFDLPGYDSRFLNSIFRYATREHGHSDDPIHSVLRVDPVEESSPFTSISSPFAVVERGPGGHAPYGNYTGRATEYFKDRKNANAETIREDYKRSIQLDFELFSARVEELREMGELEETLVVYTSDHGELLGEGGLLGHNDPMVPELCHVPTVFVHPSLDTMTVTETSFHHVDLLPTVCSVLRVDKSWWADVDGDSATDSPPTHPRPTFWENQFLTESVPGVSGSLRYEGMWDSAGGIVFADSTLADRMTVLTGKLIRSSKSSFMRRNLLDCIQSYSWCDQTYGKPGFSPEQAKQSLEEIRSQAVRVENNVLNFEARERLHELGYLNE